MRTAKGGKLLSGKLSNQELNANSIMCLSTCAPTNNGITETDRMGWCGKTKQFSPGEEAQKEDRRHTFIPSCPLTDSKTVQEDLDQNRISWPALHLG